MSFREPKFDEIGVLLWIKIEEKKKLEEKETLTEEDLENIKELEESIRILETAGY